MRSEIKRLQEYQQRSMRVFEALASNHQSANILKQLRDGEGIENIARSVERSVLTSKFNEYPYSKSQETSSVDAEHLQELLPVQRTELARRVGQRVILGDETESQDPLNHHGPKCDN